MDTSVDQYDSPWKEVIERYFPEFMAFYFPDAYAEIDWAKEHVFLDQELRAVVQDAELGKRFVDRLVRVNVLNGGESWIYIHVEVQGTKQAEFASIRNGMKRNCVLYGYCINGSGINNASSICLVFWIG